MIYDGSLDKLLQKVWEGERIDQAEALRLYQLPLEELGALADRRDRVWLIRMTQWVAISQAILLPCAGADWAPPMSAVPMEPVVVNRLRAVAPALLPPRRRTHGRRRPRRPAAPRRPPPGPACAQDP